MLTFVLGDVVAVSSTTSVATPSVCTMVMASVQPMSARTIMNKSATLHGLGFMLSSSCSSNC